MNNKITVDFTKSIGKIKPLHGVNNGPKTRAFSMDTSQYFKEAAIPYARLHDTEYPYGSGHYVDIPCIFPDFNADVDDPNSYDFELTDYYIKAIIDCGTEVVYRLGASIEHAPKKYNIFPPKDNLKWAKICEGIIRHYNEGWADGYYYNIKYWEIWNEPDNHPDMKLNPMWQGTKEQYFQLYEVASNHLKNKFPDLKIGGYAHCGFYALLQPNDARMKYFMDFMYEFFDYITSEEHKSPLDFFSWHTYSGDVSFYVKEAYFVREVLDKYGFKGTESSLNEWNYSGEDMFTNMRTIVGASCVASVLCAMQKAPVDSAMYYDGQPTMRYCGIFDFPNANPTKTFYSFKAFNELYQLGIEVHSQSPNENIYVCAARNDNEGAALMANYNGGNVTCDFDFIGGSIKEIYVMDKDSEYHRADINIKDIAFDDNTVLLIKFNT